MRNHHEADQDEIDVLNPFMAWYFGMVRRFIGEEIRLLDLLPPEEDRDWCLFTTQPPAIGAK